MKAGVIVIGLIILAIIVGGIYFLSKSSETKVSNPEQDVDRIIIGDPEPRTITSPESEVYQDFSQGSFERASGMKRVLFFYANWCPICKPADVEFKSDMSKLPQGLVLFRVNYNDSETDQSEKDLGKKYAITYQHTFVQVDEQGNEVAKWNGGGVDNLISQIK